MVEQFVDMKMKNIILNTWKNKLSYPLNHKDIEELEGIIDYYEGENQELRKQIVYLRSSEYLNQLKFERDMLQDIVDKMKVSKEDREFIDCTHRNTELLEENQQLKKQLEEKDRIIKKAKKIIKNRINDISKLKIKLYPKGYYELLEILNIDKGDD